VTKTSWEAGLALGGCVSWQWEADYLVPGGESVGHPFSPAGGGEPVAAGAEVRRYAAEGGQVPLRVFGGSEALHGMFALPGGLVGVLRPGCSGSTDITVDNC
jgi:hypothetical protein